MRFTLPIVAGAAAAVLSAPAEGLFVPAGDSSRVKTLGRMLPLSGQQLAFDWAGSRFSFVVANATYVNAVIQDNSYSGTRMSVYLDAPNHLPHVLAGTFATSQGQTNYTLVQGPGLGNLPSTFQVTVVNEIEPAFIGEGPADNTLLVMEGFSTDGVLLAAPAASPRKLEFIGDSITAGFGSNAISPCDASLWTNQYSGTWSDMVCNGPAPIGSSTVTGLAADCNVQAWSGIGMYCNYFSTDIYNCAQEQTMPQHYPYVLGSQSQAGDLHWNFQSFVPDAVVIALGTNDFSMGRGQNASYVAAYEQTYLNFIQTAAANYGNKSLPFFLAVGPMSTLYMTAVQSVIDNASALGYSATMINMSFPQTQYGCGGHPTRASHAQMAAITQQTIAGVLGW